MSQIAVNDTVMVLQSSGSAIYTGKTGTVIKMREAGGHQAVCTVSMTEDHRELKFVKGDLDIVSKAKTTESPPAGTDDHW